MKNRFFLCDPSVAMCILHVANVNSSDVCSLNEDLIIVLILLDFVFLVLWNKFQKKHGNMEHYYHGMEKLPLHI